MPIFRVKSIKIYTGQKNLHERRSLCSWQISGMTIIIIIIIKVIVIIIISVIVITITIIIIISRDMTMVGVERFDKTKLQVADQPKQSLAKSKDMTLVKIYSFQN